MKIDLSLGLVLTLLDGSTTNFSSYLIRHQRFRMLFFCWLILIDKNLRCGLCTPLLRQPDRIVLDEKKCSGSIWFPWTRSLQETWSELAWMRVCKRRQILMLSGSIWPTAFQFSFQSFMIFFHRWTSSVLIFIKLVFLLNLLLFWIHLLSTNNLKLFSVQWWMTNLPIPDSFRKELPVYYFSVKFVSCSTWEV